MARFPTRASRGIGESLIYDNHDTRVAGVDRGRTCEGDPAVSELLSAAETTCRQHLLAKARFDHAFTKWWATVPPCTDDTGWKLLERFRKEIDTYCFTYKRSEGVAQAASEMFRLVLVDQATWTLTDIYGFAVWYDKLKDKISNAIGHLFEYYGDSFSDLCDSLPLAGQEVVSRCLASHPKSKSPRRDGFLEEQEIAAAIEVVKWRTFICEGENYVEMALADQSRKWFKHFILRESQWSQEDEKTLSHIYHDD